MRALCASLRADARLAMRTRSGAALAARRGGFARDLGRGLLDCGRGRGRNRRRRCYRSDGACRQQRSLCGCALGSSIIAARRRAIASSRLSFHLRRPPRMYSGLMSSMSQTLSNEKTQRLSSCAIHSSGIAEQPLALAGGRVDALHEAFDRIFEHAQDEPLFALEQMLLRIASKY